MKSFISFAAIKIHLIGILFFSSPLLSQVITVRGNVTAGTVPVRYASIVFTDKSDTSKKFSAITDTAGNYQIGIITTVEKNSSIVPSSIELEQNYPNPFSSSTAISYQINKQLDVSIKIYDILGRIVKAYVLGSQEIGGYGIVWDGTDNFGKKVSPGIYFYQMRAGDETLVKKMVFGLGGASVSLAMPKTNKYFTKELSKELLAEKKENRVEITAGTYIVQITNTDSTQPRIAFIELLNITIQHDTTMNFNVQEAEQWRYLGLGNETVTAIAVDPSNSQIIYAGTKYNFSAGINGKLFKSADGGTTWDTLLIGGSYRSILIDPLNHNIIYALPGGIIKSENGGQTWKTLINGIYLDPETRLQSLAMNPKNSNVLYAGTGGFFGGNFYKSYNGGLNWNKISSDSLSDGVISIAIDPIDTNNVYAGTAWRGILWKSTDAGATWFRTGLGDTGSLIDIVTVNPKHNNIVYAGIRFEGLFVSSDRGETWKKEGLPDSVQNCTDIEFNSTDEFDIYVATALGVFNQKCENCSWQKLNEGISENRLINVVAIGKQYLYAGRATIREKNGGIFVRSIAK